MFLKGKIITAFMLDDDVLDGIIEQFEKRYNASIDFAVEVNASIGGGVIVSVQDDVFDGSIKGRLKSIRDQVLA